MRTRSFATRRLVAMVLVLLGAIVFTVRLVDVQVVSAPQLNEDSRDKRSVPERIASVRGDIVDRDGVVLATTDERYDVQLSPKNVEYWRKLERAGDWVPIETETAFREIAALTGQTPEEIAKIVDDALAEDPNSDFAFVKREVDLTTLNALKALDIPWMTFDINHQRSYPNGAVAGNIVGFTGSDGQPQAGIELAQQECLVGTDGEENYERGADGVRLPGSGVISRQVENGGTVQLTLHRDLQYEAQQAINEQAMAVGAEWAFLLIMDAKTGELLAVAEDFSVDPNDVSASDSERREARSFTWPYEPGSTLKTLTAASLIDAGAANVGTRNLTPYSWEPEPSVSFSDSSYHEDKRWTLGGIIVESSNVGIAMLGSRLDEQTRYEYLKKFGLGEATDAGMPLESSGTLLSPDEWDRQTNYNTMFGQGLSSTIVQTASAYQAIANDGVRIPPKLVKGCVNDGELEEHESGKPVRVISAEAAAETRHMLEAMAVEGWLSADLSVPGYRVGGKTGTAEQGDGAGGYRSDYVYNYAGMFPMDDPQFVVVSSVAFPARETSSRSAATPWQAAVEATIRTFHVPPSSGSYEPLPLEY